MQEKENKATKFYEQHAVFFFQFKGLDLNHMFRSLFVLEDTLNECVNRARKTGEAAVECKVYDVDEMFMAVSTEIDIFLAFPLQEINATNISVDPHKKRFFVSHLKLILNELQEKKARARQLLQSYGNFLQTNGQSVDHFLEPAIKMEQEILNQINSAHRAGAVEIELNGPDGKPFDMNEACLLAHQLLNKILAIPPPAPPLLNTGNPTPTLLVRETSAKPEDLKTKWRILGDARSKKGDLVGATQAYEKVVAIDPKSLEVWNELGAIYFKQKKLDLATKAFRQVLALAPTDVSALVNLGSALVAGKQVEEGLKYLDQGAGLGDAQARGLASQIRSKQKSVMPQVLGTTKKFPVSRLQSLLKNLLEKKARVLTLVESNRAFFQSKGMSTEQILGPVLEVEREFSNAINRAMQANAAEVEFRDPSGQPFDFDKASTIANKLLDEVLSLPKNLFTSGNGEPNTPAIHPPIDNVQVGPMEIGSQPVAIGDKFHCLFCGKDFGNFTTHVRAKHPEFYQIQLKYELEVFPKRQQALEELEPSIKQIPRGMVKKGGAGVGLSATISSDQSKGSIIELDYAEYLDALGWERLQFPQTALALLAETPDARLGGQDINRHQLEVIYQTSFNNFKREKEFSTPRREALALLRDYCGELMDQWRNRLDSHQKEQATLASGGYTCSNCGIAFKSKSALSTHIRKTHPAEYEKQIEAQERANKERQIAFVEKNVTERHPINQKEKIANEKARQEIWEAYMVARRKFEMFLSQGRINEALEQLRIGVLKLKESDDHMMSTKRITNLKTGEQRSINESLQDTAKVLQVAQTPEGLEQFRVELSKQKGRQYSTEEARQVITNLSRMTEETDRVWEKNKRLSYQFFVDQAKALFQKHYKNQEIPREIQDVLDSL